MSWHAAAQAALILRYEYTEHAAPGKDFQMSQEHVYVYIVKAPPGISVFYVFVISEMFHDGEDFARSRRKDLKPVAASCATKDSKS